MKQTFILLLCIFSYANAVLDTTYGDQWNIKGMIDDADKAFTYEEVKFIFPDGVNLGLEITIGWDLNCAADRITSQGTGTEVNWACADGLTSSWQAGDTPPYICTEVGGQPKFTLSNSPQHRCLAAAVPACDGGLCIDSGCKDGVSCSAASDCDASVAVTTAVDTAVTLNSGNDVFCVGTQVQKDDCSAASQTCNAGYSIHSGGNPSYVCSGNNVVEPSGNAISVKNSGSPDVSSPETISTFMAAGVLPAGTTVAGGASSSVKASDSGVAEHGNCEAILAAMITAGGGSNSQMITNTAMALDKFLELTGYDIALQSINAGKTISRVNPYIKYVNADDSQATQWNMNIGAYEVPNWYRPQGCSIYVSGVSAPTVYFNIVRGTGEGGGAENAGASIDCANTGDDRGVNTNAEGHTYCIGISPALPCAANTCTCTGGTAGTGADCTTNGAEKCTACTAGYTQNGDVCDRDFVPADASGFPAVVLNGGNPVMCDATAIVDNTFVAASQACAAGYSVHAGGDPAYACDSGAIAEPAATRAYEIKDSGTGSYTYDASISNTDMSSICTPAGGSNGGSCTDYNSDTGNGACFEFYQNLVAMDITTVRDYMISIGYSQPGGDANDFTELQYKKTGSSDTYPTGCSIAQSAASGSGKKLIVRLSANLYPYNVMGGYEVECGGNYMCLKITQSDPVGKCDANTCTCTTGTVAAGADCTTNGAEKCTACPTGWTLTGDVCEEDFTAVDTSGVAAAVTLNSGNDVGCDGTAIVDDQGAAVTQVCNAGYSTPGGDPAYVCDSDAIATPTAAVYTTSTSGAPQIPADPLYVSSFMDDGVLADGTVVEPYPNSGQDYNWAVVADAANGKCEALVAAMVTAGGISGNFLVDKDAAFAKFEELTGFDLKAAEPGITNIHGKILYGYAATDSYMAQNYYKSPLGCAMKITNGGMLQFNIIRGDPTNAGGGSTTCANVDYAASGGKTYCVNIAPPSACTANTCTCTGGTVATGADCTTDGAEMCTGCNSGYTLNGDVCDPVQGCMNSLANNYNAVALVDDGSCTFDDCTIGHDLYISQVCGGDCTFNGEYANIHNSGSATCDLTGFKIGFTNSFANAYTLSLSIVSGGYGLVDEPSSFDPDTGDTIYLFDANGNVFEAGEILEDPNGRDPTYFTIDGTSCIGGIETPGAANAACFKAGCMDSAAINHVADASNQWTNSENGCIFNCPCTGGTGATDCTSADNGGSDKCTSCNDPDYVLSGSVCESTVACATALPTGYVKAAGAHSYMIFDFNVPIECDSGYVQMGGATTANVCTEDGGAITLTGGTCQLEAIGCMVSTANNYDAGANTADTCTYNCGCTDGTGATDCDTDSESKCASCDSGFALSGTQCKGECPKSYYEPVGVAGCVCPGNGELGASQYCYPGDVKRQKPLCLPNGAPNDATCYCPESDEGTLTWTECVSGEMCRDLDGDATTAHTCTDQPSVSPEEYIAIDPGEMDTATTAEYALASIACAADFAVPKAQNSLEYECHACDRQKILNKMGTPHGLKATMVDGVLTLARDTNVHKGAVYGTCCVNAHHSVCNAMISEYKTKCEGNSTYKGSGLSCI